MSEATPYGEGKSGLMVLNVLEALSGFAANGARNSDLAGLVQTSAPNITRVLAVLVAKGWARKAENTRYYPTPEFTRMVFRVMADFEKLETRVSDSKRSMTGQ